MTTPHALIDTPRLRLRPWREADKAPFAELNADPSVMRHFPARLSRADSDALVERARVALETRGFGWWAAERRDTRQFIGFIGLSTVPDDLPCAPGVEIGWRLARAHWGQGLASEGARAALALAFGPLGLDQVLSFTALSNTRSQAVMQRIGMQDAQAPFEHPRLPVGHPLRPHVLYRLSREAWLAASAGLSETVRGHPDAPGMDPASP